MALQRIEIAFEEFADAEGVGVEVRGYEFVEAMDGGGDYANVLE